MKRAARFLLAPCVLLGWTLNVSALMYWNGSAPGGPASGTWNNDPNNRTWSTNDFTQNQPNDPNPVSYPDRDPSVTLESVVFANGNAADGLPGPYTVTVDNSFGQVKVRDIVQYQGNCTLTGGGLDFAFDPVNDHINLIMVNSGQVITVNCVLTNSLQANPTFMHIGRPGTVIFGATNTFIGDLGIEGGTLKLASDQSIPVTSNLQLLNGDNRGGDNFSNTPPTFNTGGHNQALGILVLAGPNSLIPRIIDFENGQGALSFADSSSDPWLTTDLPNNSENPGPITLTITNYVLGQTKLRFGINGNGLTATQLAQIRFAGFGDAPGAIDIDGFVTPRLPILRIFKAGSTVRLSWSSVNGRIYRVQHKEDLQAANWTDFTPDVTATTDTSFFSDSTATTDRRFYRVVELHQ